jgi:hypothetical protein
MIDPIAGAAIVTAAASAAAVFAAEVVKEVGSTAGKTIASAPRMLVAWLRERGREDHVVNSAVTLVEDRADDETRQKMLADVLVARARRDPAFSRELIEFVGATSDHVAVGGAHIGSVTGNATVFQAGGNQINLGKADQRRKKD